MNSLDSYAWLFLFCKQSKEDALTGDEMLPKNKS
jgi:hypothetical protein